MLSLNDTHPDHDHGTPASASAQTTSLSGRFDDPTNTALVGSDLGAAQFGDVNAIANNVALYDFTVTTAGTVTIQSLGFGEGGADPYFTLFEGAGTGATFLDSNYSQAFSTGGDFIWSGGLAVGTYQIALGVFANMSFAENSGAGTLGDGFIGLGVPDSAGDGHYHLGVTTPVPEPSTWLLLAIGLAGIGWKAGRRRT